MVAQNPRFRGPRHLERGNPAERVPRMRKFLYHPMMEREGRGVDNIRNDHELRSP
jgi:hypothetical protein